MAFEIENQIKTQKWMEILENKNQKGHKLAHDLGAGSPCLQCKENCPGLDLHFWRKVCKNCKCKKESHDCQEEDDIYSKFEILFGISKCTPSQAVLDLKLRFPSDESQEDRNNFPTSFPNKKYTFDWIPPNISSELAAEYMQQLPASKLPISGSDGALYRRQQLEKQVPLHDLNANMCHNLTADEIKCLTDYLENLKTNVAGQAKIMKLPNLLNPDDMASTTLLHNKQNQTAFPTSFSADSISSIYNSVPKPFKSINNQTELLSSEEFPPPPPELLEDQTSFGSHLKTPSAFIKQSRSPSPQTNRIVNSGVVAPHENLGNVAHNQNDDSEFGDENNKNVKVGDFIRSLNRKANQSSQTNYKPVSGGSPYEPKSATSGAQYEPKSVNSCTQYEPKSTSSGVPYEPKPYESKINSVKIESFNQLDEKINLPDKMVAKNLDTINRNIASFDKPNSVKVTNLDDLVHDMSKSNLSDHNNINAGNNLDKFVHLRNKYQSGNDVLENDDSKYGTSMPGGWHSDVNRNPLETHATNDNQTDRIAIKNNEHGPSHMARTSSNNKRCKHCTLDIKYGELAIYTEKLGDNVLWHPQCFVCNTCNELLVDLMYFHYKNNVYCLRDYAHMLDIPRCFACDELIFVNEYTLTENKTYHVKHFCCYSCDKELCNQSYIPVRDVKLGGGQPLDSSDDTANSYPHCLDCYYKYFSNKCSTCNQVIDVQEKSIQFNNTYFWHINGKCFSCAQCKKSLNNEKFIMQFEKPFCSRECVLSYN